MGACAATTDGAYRGRPGNYSAPDRPPRDTGADMRCPTRLHVNTTPIAASPDRGRPSIAIGSVGSCPARRAGRFARLTKAETTIGRRGIAGWEVIVFLRARRRAAGR